MQQVGGMVLTADRQRRRYSDDERAAALAAVQANGGSVALTADQLGIPAQTLRQWATGERHPEATQESEQKKKPLAQLLEELAYKLVVHADKVHDKLNGKDALVAAAIAVDKAQLLRSMPTSTGGTLSKLDLSKLSDEELRTWQELMRKCGSKSGPAESKTAQDTV